MAVKRRIGSFRMLCEIDNEIIDEEVSRVLRIDVILQFVDRKITRQRVRAARLKRDIEARMSWRCEWRSLRIRVRSKFQWSAKLCGREFQRAKQIVIGIVVEEHKGQIRRGSGDRLAAIARKPTTIRGRVPNIPLLAVAHPVTGIAVENKVRKLRVSETSAAEQH